MDGPRGRASGSLVVLTACFLAGIPAFAAALGSAARRTRSVTSARGGGVVALVLIGLWACTGACFAMAIVM